MSGSFSPKGGNAVALRLYLDDCADANVLADLLRQAGHTVRRPREAGTTGSKDDVHLQCAVQQGLILVTKNPADFQALHRLDPTHHGIFAIYQDNDPSRDMTDAEIVAAIGRIEATVPHGYPIAQEFHSLNDWR
jgi:hypothetical protein